MRVALHGRRRLLLLGGAVLALAAAAAAAASTFAAGVLVRAPDMPLAGASAACAAKVAASTAAGSVNYPDAEVEPHVTVDPTNPSHLVATFQQDRWNDGGSNGDVVVVSDNGGASWHLASSQPTFTICQGATTGSPGFFDRTTDPWLSYSSDGKIVYAIADSFNANGPAFGGASAILISRSLDGGETWQTPVTARLDLSTTVLNDKETVTADPVAANVAYAAWDRLVSPSQHANPSAFNVSPAFRGPAMFSKTTDGGQTWSEGRPIFDPGEKNQTIGNQIVVPTAGPGKGVLIDGFSLILNKGGKGNNQRTSTSVAVIRSSDGGTTWSQPDHRLRPAGRLGERRRPGRPLERLPARVRRCARRHALRGLAGPASARPARPRSRSHARPTGGSTGRRRSGSTSRPAIRPRSCRRSTSRPAARSASSTTTSRTRPRRSRD